MLVSSSDLGRLDVSDPDAVGSMTRELLDHQEKAFWTTPWNSTSYDTNAGRKMVVDSLKLVSRNLRNGDAWNEDVALIDVSQLDTPAAE